MAIPPELHTTTVILGDSSMDWLLYEACSKPRNLHPAGKFLAVQTFICFIVDTRNVMGNRMEG